MVSSTPEVRQLNRERIRRELHVRKTCTKAEMAAWTGLSVSTCNTILNEMRADDEIIRTSQEDGYVGRPASRFEYNADYLHVLVVYVVTEHGENTVAFAVADALGQVRLSEQRHPDAITYSVIEELIAEQLATDELIRGIALGIPGVARDGVVEDCDVDALVGVDVAEGVRDRFGINPEVRNDMDFIATGQANGCRLYDIDGKEYIDFHGGSGAALFGHNHPRIKQALAGAIERGFFMNYDTADTLALAKLTRQIFPSCEKIRLANTGSEATQAAIRLARAFTGRDKVLRFDGHSEHAVRKYAGQLAAVILEPISYNCGCLEAREKFLAAVREIYTREGIVLIFAEVICGLRMSPGSAQSRFGVIPDLTTAAKAIGGGLPIALVGGKAEIIWLSGWGSVDDPVGQPVVEKIRHGLQRISDMGLDYLNLNRVSTSLSGGESQRLKMVRHLGSSLVGLTYVFDEPTVGLHPGDVDRLSGLLMP